MEGRDDLPDALAAAEALAGQPLRRSIAAAAGAGVRRWWAGRSPAYWRCGCSRHSGPSVVGSIAGDEIEGGNAVEQGVEAVGQLLAAFAGSQVVERAWPDRAAR